MKKGKQKPGKRSDTFISQSLSSSNREISKDKSFNTADGKIPISRRDQYGIASDPYQGALFAFLKIDLA
jgi:hypothetical protein